MKNANTIIGHLNSNTFEDKFVFAEEIIQVLNLNLVSESKLDNTFLANLWKLMVARFLDMTEIDLGEGFFICKWTSAMQAISRAL